jgi:fluoride ion exporter CrcB/FEX
MNIPSELQLLAELTNEQFYRVTAFSGACGGFTTMAKSEDDAVAIYKQHYPNAVAVRAELVEA